MKLSPALLLLIVSTAMLGLVAGLILICTPLYRAILNANGVNTEHFNPLWASIVFILFLPVLAINGAIAEIASRSSKTKSQTIFILAFAALAWFSNYTAAVLHGAWYFVLPEPAHMTFSSRGLETFRIPAMLSALVQFIPYWKGREALKAPQNSNKQVRF